MGFEKPKFEKKVKKQEKSETREKFEKKLRTMTAWGLITLSSLGISKFIFKEGYKPEYKPKALIAYVEEQRGPLSEIEKIELKEKIDYLREQFSDNIISHLQESVEVNKESVSKPIEIKGFEKANLSNEDLKKLWSEKYYPEGWLEEEISEVEYKDEEARGIKDYGLDKGRSAGTHKLSEGGKSRITFFRTSTPETKTEFKDFISTLDWHFSHEASHANDWANEAELDFKNRVEFLHEITQNYSREGAFRDSLGYIESIKNPDPHKERYFKVEEYWATCCDHYFTMPEMFQGLYLQEFEMVDKYVKKEDPTFDALEKAEQREELIEEFVEK